MIAIVDQRLPKDAKEQLTALGFSVISLPPFSKLASPVASHPDMLLFPIGDRIYVHREYYDEAATILERIAKKTRRVLYPIETDVSTEYPHDVTLNLFLIGKYLAGRTDRTPDAILDYASKLGYEPVLVKQGYAKCATVVLGDNAIITADPSIRDTMKPLGIDVLSISVGGVSLPGYDYGFIGGTCGVFGDRVLFCGDLARHPDAETMAAFCESHGFRADSLSHEPLFDVGSLFFL